MRRDPERPPELPAEVRGREPRGLGESRHVEGIGVAAVDQVLGAEQVAAGVGGGHASGIIHSAS